MSEIPSYDHYVSDEQSSKGERFLVSDVDKNGTVLNEMAASLYSAKWQNGELDESDIQALKGFANYKKDFDREYNTDEIELGGTFNKSINKMASDFYSKLSSSGMYFPLEGADFSNVDELKINGIGDKISVVREFLSSFGYSIKGLELEGIQGLIEGGNFTDGEKYYLKVIRGKSVMELEVVSDEVESGDELSRKQKLAQLKEEIDLDIGEIKDRQSLLDIMGDDDVYFGMLNTKQQSILKEIGRLVSKSGEEVWDIIEEESDKFGEFLAEKGDNTSSYLKLFKLLDLPMIDDDKKKMRILLGELNESFRTDADIQELPIPTQKKTKKMETPEIVPVPTSEKKKVNDFLDLNLTPDYTVEKGDSLYHILEKHFGLKGKDLEKEVQRQIMVLKLNKRGTNLQIGTEIFI